MFDQPLTRLARPDGSKHSFGAWCFVISKTARANIALSLAAFFWGTTFIAQSRAMDSLSPMAFGGLRFALGAFCLLPLAAGRIARLIRGSEDPPRLVRTWMMGSLLSGAILFVGISFQQYGLLWTTAGKAGFITSLYVVLVPIILRFMGHKIVPGEAIGCVLALTGLYLLSFTSGLFSLSLGDGLVLIGAFVWAAHVLALGRLAPRMDAIILGMGQALICGLLSLLAAAFLGEWPAWAEIRMAWADIVWAGLLSVALGFTLQVIGQKDAKPAPAAIIMQMEAVVAVVAGALFLGEVITLRMFVGMAVMLSGMLISQLWPIMVGSHQAEIQPIKTDQAAIFD